MKFHQSAQVLAIYVYNEENAWLGFKVRDDHHTMWSTVCDI